jgi:hypothetical protein
LSERFFYQKIKDIYTTKRCDKVDCCGLYQQTAAELVYRRVDASLPLLMQSFDKKNLNSIKKNVTLHLKEDEIKLLVCWLSNIWHLQKLWHNKEHRCI